MNPCAHSHEHAAVIFGDGIAAMVAALQLGKEGKQVALVHPGGRWGGHFRGLKTDQGHFDLGMIAFEFTAFAAAHRPSLAGYDENVRGDVGRFVGHVERFIAELRIEVREMQAPEMVVAGQFLPDMVIANRLRALEQLDPGLRPIILAELLAANAACGGDVHPRHKSSWPEDASHDLRRLSLANHGEALHDLLVESLCRKLAGVDSSTILARYHRALWAPLYYPETLLATMQGAPVSLAPTKFHYPAGHGFHVVVDRLLEQLTACPHVRLVEDRLADASGRREGSYGLSSGNVLRAQRAVWTGPPDALLGLVEPGTRTLPAMDRASIGLAFVKVERERCARLCSVAHVLDRERLAYRVTNQSFNAGAQQRVHEHMIVEYSLEHATSLGIHDEPSAARWLSGELVDLGFVHDHSADIRCKHLAGALTLATAHNVHEHRRARAALNQQCPEIALLAGSAAFGCGSFNDQIIQGLAFAATL